MTRRRRLLLLAVLAAVLLAAGGWLFFNPPGRFGSFSRFGITVYSAWPYPGSDLAVDAAGRARTVNKTHALTLADLEPLLDPAPEVLIIAAGWNGAVQVPEEVRAQLRERGKCAVLVLKTGAALAEYNRLKGLGKRVAIRVHSTC